MNLPTVTEQVKEAPGRASRSQPLLGLYVLFLLFIKMIFFKSYNSHRVKCRILGIQFDKL